MRESSIKCYTCKSFSGYFIRRNYQFCEESNGYCALHKRVMEKKDKCSDWQCRNMNREPRALAIASTLCEIRRSLQMVESILKDEVEIRKLFYETTMPVE